MTYSAVVFAYHNVGVRCLSVLLAKKVNIQLIVTHQDDTQEAIWFHSVKQLANDHHIPVIMPDYPNQAEIVARVQSLMPDFIFSFYYRHILSSAILQSARYACYNMHGSLLPKYRGRAPANWAVLHGEKETGVTLHLMSIKPDQGDIAAQKAIPILPNDTAYDVMQKITVAAELCLYEIIDVLLQRKIVLKKQTGNSSYFSGRKAEDGQICWQGSSQAVHNLVRAVAPPYPGAFFDYQTHRIMITRTRLLSQNMPQYKKMMWCTTADGIIYAAAQDGQLLQILAATIAGQILCQKNWLHFFSKSTICLDND